MKILYCYNIRSNRDSISSICLNADRSTSTFKPLIRNFILSYDIILISSIDLKTISRIALESSTSTKIDPLFTDISRYFFCYHSSIFLENSRLFKFSIYIYKININRKNRHHNKPQYCNGNYEFDEGKAFLSHLMKLKN